MDENKVLLIKDLIYKNQGQYEIKERAQSAFKTATKRGAPQASRLIINEKLSKVNNNVSKIVDINGEPKPVFYGTQAVFLNVRNPYKFDSQQGNPTKNAET